MEDGESRTLPLAAVQGRLTEMVAAMAGNGELILTTDGVPVAVVKRLERTRTG